MLAITVAFFVAGCVIPLASWVTFDCIAPALPLASWVVAGAGLALLGRRRARLWLAVLSFLAGYSLARSEAAEVALDYAWCEAVSATQSEAAFLCRVDDISNMFATRPSMVVTLIPADSGAIHELSVRHPRLLVYLETDPRDQGDSGTKLPLEGDTVEIYGRIDPVKGPKFFGGVNPRATYLPRKIVGVVSDATVISIREGSDGGPRAPLCLELRRVLSSIRVMLSSAVQEALPEAEAGIVMSGFLGMQGTLPDYVDDAMRRAGISHLLSVSGMHVSMVAAGIALLLGALTSDPKKARLLGVPVVCLYAVLAGARVSVLRALLMFTLASLSVAGALGWSQRRIAEFVALVLMIANPLQLAQVSFQLSFGATYGIIVLSSLWPRRRQDISGVKSVSSSVRTWLANTAIVSLGAQAGVVPILAFHFRSLPLIGGPATVLASPLFVLGVGFTLAGLAAGAVGLGVVSVLLIRLGSVFLRALISGAVVLGRMEYCCIDLPWTWSRAIACGVASVWIPLLSVRRNNLTRAPKFNRWSVAAVGAIVSVSVILAGASQIAAKSQFELYVLSVGQGDCVVCVTPGDRTLVVDAGPAFQGSGYSFNAGESVLLPFLKWRGISHVDVFILTHFHDDHFGGLSALVDRGMVSVICSPDPLMLRSLLEREELGSVDTTVDQSEEISGQLPLLVRLKAGDVIRVGDVVVDVLWPSSELELSGDENARSIVLLLTYHQLNVMLTGDIGADQEIEIVNRLRNSEQSVHSSPSRTRPLLSSGLEVLKVAHHGSRHSSSHVFLRSLSPWLSIISTGTNRHGHPSPEAISRITRYSEVVIRTDEDGSVKVWSDGSHLKAVTSRGRPVTRHLPLM